MIQFILTLFSLVFSNSDASTIHPFSPKQETMNTINDGGPVGGNSGQTPPSLVNP